MWLNGRAAVAAICLITLFSNRLVADTTRVCPPGAEVVDVSEFVNSRVQAIGRAQATQHNNTNQTQLPTISGNSPSLVDESSASDLIGIGLNLIGVSSQSPDNTSTSATVSAFALKSALANRDPLETEYYNRNAGWRRMSFTLGVDFPQSSDNPQAERGIVVGGKVLLYNARDISTDAHFTEEAEKPLVKAATQINEFMNNQILDESLSEETLCMNGAQEMVEISKIPTSRLQEIDALILHSAPDAVGYGQAAAKLANDINQRPQVAAEFLTTQRKGNATSEYTGNLIGDLGWHVDLGFADSVALTFNAAYDYEDRGLEKDSQGGKAGAKVRLFEAQADISDRVPWTLTLAGSGKWLTNATPEYRVQLGISIALFDGVEFPLSVSWANQTEFADEQQVLGNIGFTGDFAKLAARLRR